MQYKKISRSLQAEENIGKIDLRTVKINTDKKGLFIQIQRSVIEKDITL